MKKYLSMAAMTILLGACGGGGGGYGGGGGGSSYTPPPVAYSDAFIAYVATTVSIAPDTVDATIVDAIVATVPENSEPIPVS